MKCPLDKITYTAIFIILLILLSFLIFSLTSCQKNTINNPNIISNVGNEYREELTNEEIVDDKSKFIEPVKLDLLNDTVGSSLDEITLIQTISSGYDHILIGKLLGNKYQILLNPFLSVSAFSGITSDVPLPDIDDDSNNFSTYISVNDLSLFYVDPFTLELKGYNTLDTNPLKENNINNIRIDGKNFIVNSEDVFAFLVFVTKSNEAYKLHNTVSNNYFILNNDFPEDLKELCLEMPDDPYSTLVSTDKVVLAFFHVLSGYADSDITIDLIAYSKIFKN